MNKGKRITRFFIVFAALLLAGFVVMWFGGFPRSWEPSSEIAGETPTQKASSLAQVLNAVVENNFAKVFFEGHDPKKGLWSYSVFVTEPGVLFRGKASVGDPTGQQSAKVKQKVFFEDIVGRIFVETAQFEGNVEKIVVKVILPTSIDSAGGVQLGIVYIAEGSAITEIRKHPKAWNEVVDLANPEPLIAFYPSMNRARTFEVAGETPIEKVRSLVAFLNDRPGNDFEKIFFDEYDGEQGLWKFTVLVTDPFLFGDGTQSRGSVEQFKIEMHWDNIKNLFVRIPEWDENAKGIGVKVLFPSPIDSTGFAYGFVYATNELGVKNLRMYPENWALYVGIQRRDPERIFLIPQSALGSLVEKLGGQKEAQNSGTEEGK